MLHLFLSKDCWWGFFDITEYVSAKWFRFENAELHDQNEPWPIFRSIYENILINENLEIQDPDFENEKILKLEKSSFSELDFGKTTFFENKNFCKNEILSSNLDFEIQDPDFLNNKIFKIPLGRNNDFLNDQPKIFNLPNVKFLLNIQINTL